MKSISSLNNSINQGGSYASHKPFNIMITINSNLITNAEATPIVNNLNNYITDGYTLWDPQKCRDTKKPILTLMGTNITDIEDINVRIWDFTFQNNFYNDEDNKKLSQEEDLDIDLKSLIQEFADKYSLDWNVEPSDITITNILCIDTANPYQIIKISVYEEYSD